MTDRLITPAEAAELLGVTTSTLRRWEDRGHLDARRTVGGHRRFTRGDVEQLADELADTRHALERSTP